ncbi:MAG: cupin domain-containing protein [Burkholderiaceae bacterium]
MKAFTHYFPLHIAALLIPMLLPFPVMAQGDTTGQTFINPTDIKWGDAPPSLPKGAKLAVLSGDPGKEGPFVMRLKAPAGYKIAPHWHTQNENLTIISGALYLGMGDKMDTAQAHPLKTGGFHFLPGKAHHFAFTKTPTVVQIHGQGPFDINYINPDDDPQRAAAKK